MLHFYRESLRHINTHNLDILRAPTYKQNLACAQYNIVQNTYAPFKSTRTNKHFGHTHGFSQAAIMLQAALSFLHSTLVVFKPAYFLLITANGLLFRGSTRKRAVHVVAICEEWWMWWRERGERGESEVCRGDAVTTAYIYTCICVCLLEEKKDRVCNKRVRERGCVCAGAPGSARGGGGWGVKVIML